MVIYNFYQSFIMLFASANDGVGSLLGNSRPFVFAVCFGLGLIAALFVLQAAGVYRMAKKQGLKKKWLAFVPFANLWYIGKLAGSFEVFGHKMKRAGLYTMIAQIVTTVLCFSSMAAEMYLFIECADAAIVNGANGSIQFSGLSKVGSAIYNYYNIASYLVSIVGFVYSVLLLILLMGLYRKYYPKGYMFLAWLGIFVPLSRYIVIFVLRNYRPIDYNEYMRRKREAYARRYGNMGGYGNPYGNPYGGNPYGNPYGGNPYGGNPYGNPYGSPYGNPYGESPKSEEPFSEFGSESGGENGAKSDGAASGGGSAGTEQKGEDDLFD